jgi:hypothetical protein
MERRQDKDPKKEEEHREHGRSDRGGPGREQRPNEKQFPGQEGRPEFEQTRNPDRQSGEAQRDPRRESEEQPPNREDGARKFGERREQPPARRNQRS